MVAILEIFRSQVVCDYIDAAEPFGLGGDVKLTEHQFCGMNNDRLGPAEKLELATLIFDRQDGLIRYAADECSPYFGSTFILVQQEPIGKRSFLLKYVHIAHIKTYSISLKHDNIEFALRIPTLKKADYAARERLRLPPPSTGVPPKKYESVKSPV